MALIAAFRAEGWIFDMGIIAKFLENSSICGWAHIANSKTKIEKLYWIVVSVSMVAGALYLIADAFDDWAKNPISTITEPETIYNNVRFPKITVCPPKVSFSFTNFKFIKDSCNKLWQKHANTEPLFENNKT